MRVLAWACLALAGCFGPTIGDGSFLCEDGLECPEGMFCRTDCSPRRCYFDPTAACPADAGAVVDSPQPIGDSPRPTADSPLPVFDGPPVAADVPSPIIDARVDAGIIVIADGLIRISDAGVVISTDAL